MNPLKRLARETAVYGLSSIVGRLLNYFLVPLYTRIFLPHEYGIVTELYAYASFLMVFLTFGMETTFFRYSESHDEKDRVYSTSIIPVIALNLAFITLGILGSSLIADRLHYDHHSEYLIYFVMIVGLDAIAAIPFAKMRQQHRALRFAVLKLINIAINVVLNLFFLLLCPYLLKHGFQAISVVYSPSMGVGYVFLSNMIASAVGVFLLFGDIFRFKVEFDGKLFREMIVYALPLLLAGLAGMVNETLDRILLRYLLVIPAGAANANEYIMAQIGIYGANYKVSILMTLFIQTFRYAAEPFFFAHAKQTDSRQLYAKVMNYFILFGLVIFLGIMLYINIVKHFIGAKFYSGIGIVPILLLANLFLGIIFNLSIWYKLNNKTRYGAYITIFGAVVTIASNYFLIPLMGYAGAAWATFLCYFLMMILSYVWGQKHFYIKYDLSKIAGYFMLALIIFFASKSWRFHSAYMPLIANSLMFIGFIGFVFYKENLVRLFVRKQVEI
ncbi:MAG TPA: oligosaccharide flippase family protein [Geobacteraceae bacterium]|nr:oligosaccharide flippase family protein [Geobacteraceae bacterium]